MTGRLRLKGRELGAVLFDLDGTLVRSHASVERAWTTWATEHGVDASWCSRTSTAAWLHSPRRTGT